MAQPALRQLELEGRHLLFRLGAFELDLLHTDSGALTGQLIAPVERRGELAGLVAVLHGEGQGRLAQLEDAGDFHFPGVPPGRYTLVIEGLDEELVVEELELRGDPGEGGES